MKSIRIRMYRQGLGDCFLLTFPGDEGEAHVLVDCGVLIGTEDAQSRMQEVVQNILESTDGRLDALVVTHEHWDHVSGFLQAEETFDQLAVGEVWLAWTENPRDKLARELDKRKDAVLRAIAAARKLGGDVNFSLAQRLDALMGFFGNLGADGRRTTAKAMAWVKNRPNAKIRYFQPEGEPFAVPRVQDVRVYVLGPPRDPKMLKKSDPSKKNGEVYELAGESGSDLGFFTAVEALDHGVEAREQPFGPWFRVSETEAREEKFFAERYWLEEESWRRIEHDWLDTAERLALQLDSDTNNTCLVLAFELSKSARVLLFPGDAQVGNWLSWEALKWKVREGDEIKTVTAHDLLTRTVLYKVGHHGSHNATLREKGLELMSSDEFAAMIPVSRETAKKMRWNMPFPPLFQRLQEQSGGRILDQDNGVSHENPGHLGELEWRHFVARTDVQEGWIDYWVEL